MSKHFLIFLMSLLGACLFGAEAPTAKSWSWDIENGMLRITFQVPEGYYAYAGSTGPELLPSVEAFREPEAVKKKDPLLDAEIEVYPGPGKYQWEYPLKSVVFPLTVSAEWQVCKEKTPDSEAMCLFPGKAGLAMLETRSDIGKLAGTAAVEKEPEEEEPVMLREYTVLRRASGYLSPEKFIAFLNDDTGMHASFTFAKRGVLASLLLALLGGLALNLTPCVLPLIPVNLAVIGAGKNSEKTRRERLFRGCLYGGGIALTYGLLGVFAVLTGSTFGQLDSSWIFNGIAALVFLFLGLAMFDLFRFDLSGAAGRFRLPSSSHYIGVFLMGALSAVLAGACVAPVIAAALVQASNLAASGNYAGLFLPLLVGIGMALPWPFAAAGLALFPKPGAWMNHVKHVLGILILALGIYYTWTAIALFCANVSPETGEDGTQPRTAYEIINAALEESGRTGKPVLLEFGASWCKACRLMEVRTLPDPEVKRALESVIFRKISAEQPGEPRTAELLKEFGVAGLPEMILLVPESPEKSLR